MSSQLELPLGGGRFLPLPRPWCAAEFLLPGNHEIHLDGAVVAIYDETSRTGAVWCAEPLAWWTVVQPFKRDDFFSRYVPHCVEMVASGAVGWEESGH